MGRSRHEPFIDEPARRRGRRMRASRDDGSRQEEERHRVHDHRGRRRLPRHNEKFKTPMPPTM